MAVLPFSNFPVSSKLEVGKGNPSVAAWVGLRVKRVQTITASVKLNSRTEGRKRIADTSNGNRDHDFS